MSEFMKLAIVFISMLVLFYFLWVNGYMILNAKRALLFVVSLRGKNKCEVSFSSCMFSYYILLWHFFLLLLYPFLSLV